MKKASRCFVLTMGLMFMLILVAQAQDDVFIQASNDAQVYLAHGIPGLEFGLDLDNAVEIWIGDERLIENMKFGQFLGPYFIKPGTYIMKVYTAGFGPDKGSNPALQRSYNYKAGELSLVVGHLTKNGESTLLTRFPLDFSPILDKKKTRVSVFHCAAYAHLVAAFYDWNSKTEHPYVGNEAMESTDKFVTEIGKGFKWAFYVQEAKLDGSGRLLYDKVFKTKPQKAYMVVIVGTPNSPSFKVVAKVHKKKLK